MYTIKLPKDSVKVTEYNNEIHLELFALTQKDKKQIVKLFEKEDHKELLYSIDEEIIIDFIKENYNIEDLVEVSWY